MSTLKLNQLSIALFSALMAFNAQALTLTTTVTTDQLGDPDIQVGSTEAPLKLAVNSVSNSTVSLTTGANGNIDLYGWIHAVQAAYNNSIVTLGSEDTNSVKLNSNFSSTQDYGASGVISGVNALFGATVDINAKNIEINVEAGEKEARGLAIGSRDDLISYNQTVATIGSDKTENLVIRANGNEASMGVFSLRANTVLQAKNIDISTNGYYGVLVQNNTQTALAPEKASSLTLKGNQITVNALNGAGLMAFSNGQLNVEGNLVVNAINAVDTRGNATININTSGNYTTVLNGDIVFETPNEQNGDSHQSGEIINSKVTVGLTGENSSWTGRAYQSFPGNEDGVNLDGNGDFYGNVENFTVNISDGARWEMTGNSLANNVNVKNGGAVTVHEKVAEANLQNVDLDNGILNLEGSSNQTVTVSTLSGSGDLNVKATTEDGKTLVTPKLAVNGVDPDEAPNLKVTATGITADQIVDADSAMKSLSDGLDLYGVNTVQTITEGDVNGAISQVIDAKGNAQAVTVSKNTKLDAFGSVAALNAVAWRHELNSVSKRMGELRDAPEGVGAWARLYGSEMEYGDQNIESQNTTIQIGSDYKIGQWTVGATVGYTDGESDYDRGSSDNEAWNFGVYGTWFAENGQYVDLIAKYSRLSQDFKLDTMKGDYDNNAFVISAEYGWHLPVMEIGFIEPQVELTYGRIMGKDFTTSNGVEIEQDDFDSFIGRLGVRAGIKCPDDWGTVYARASVVHDFDGEFDATARSLKTSATADIYEDLGGTWGEFGIGANINFTKNTYMYVDAEITSGGEVDENYRWNIGVRHNF